MGINSDFWAGRRVLITGHTGFKGAWLSLWLQRLGAELTGLAPAPPTRPSLFELTGLGANMREHRVDVRDARAVRDALAHARPEVVLHLAAQPMVRRSLREPAMTYEVNVLGTVNLLEAVRLAPDQVRAVVIVTSDKCYANATGPGRARGPGGRAGPVGPAGAADTPVRRFIEGDPLGGDDPYSSSKACAELVAASYRASFFHGDGSPRVATARAGNVIGGGDWGEDRLVPDIVRALHAGEPVRVRNPHAVRPWQHVLNPLSGYLLLAQELWRTGEVARAWNFGPRDGDARTVAWILERLDALRDGGLRWETDDRRYPPEADQLALDSSAAERRLEWRPRWALDEALRKVVQWHDAHRGNADMRAFSLDQIEEFEST